MTTTMYTEDSGQAGGDNSKRADLIEVRRSLAAFLAGLGDRITRQQKAVVDAVDQHRRLIVQAGHGVGKSWLAARVVLWYLLTRYNARVITSAPTWHQVDRILWREIRLLAGRLGLRPAKTMLELSPTWWAGGLSTNDPTRWQGIHGPHVMVVLDEAAGIAAEYWDAAETLVLGPDDKLLAIGNPTDTTSAMADRARRWPTVRLSCLDHPNVRHRRVMVPGAVTWEWVEERRQEYGEDSPMWYARVLGEWPRESTGVLFSAELLDRALVTGLEVGAPVVIGVDVARYGRDRTVIAGVDAARHACILESHAVTSVPQVADMVRQRYRRALVVVDDVGVGGGVTDLLRRDGMRVMAHCGGAGASSPELFGNLRAETYWGLRRAMSEGLSVRNDAQLRLELAAMTMYYDARGRICMTPKDEQRRSPDAADALAMAVWGWSRQQPIRMGVIPR